MKIRNLLFCAFVMVVADLSSQDYSIFTYRELGPYRGGRVTAVAGTVMKPGTFYLGATGGGVWKTTDYGTSWKNISDKSFLSPSIGAIEVAVNDPNVIYVGTGSDGLRSNVIAGNGMYKSIDAGKNWKHIGLDKTGHIGAVRIHPDNHNIVYAAAIGHAFDRNEERGIYKTTDGGETWEKILYLSDSIGFSDIELMPTNPEILYASAWQAERKPWTIRSGGLSAENGIFKSVDGGKNWRKVEKGIPAQLIGKIDLAVTPSDSKIVYALIEAPGMQGGLFKSKDQGESFQYISSNKDIRNRPFYYTNIKIDPVDPDIIYALATRYLKSTDGGKTWKRLRPPHGDNHDQWINPNNPELFIQSNDGGANVTFNGGETWSTQFNQPTAEIYQVEVDDQYPYWVYGGQQDNSSTIAVPTRAPYGHQSAGTGFIIHTGGCETGPAVPKPGNHNIVYANCKGRFGVYDKTTGTEKGYYVGASNMYGHNPKDLKFRFQRVSPIHVSPHNADVVYHCSQYVHKTNDDGVTWETISPDLTAFEKDKQVISGKPITRDITGEEFYSTIYSIRESPLTEGLIWVGANDGPIHVTRDGGTNWTNVTPGDLPPGGRVDAVEPSPHNSAKAYVAVLRYQLGDWTPYIYRTNNFGQSWSKITSGIPDGYPVRVVREDPNREGVLYAGTEYGMFVSLDDGASWQSFQQNLPVTPITDIKLHRGDLVLSTMGRGFWIIDNLTPLWDDKYAGLNESYLFKPRNAIRYKYPSGARSSNSPRYPRPSAFMDYFLNQEANKVKLEIINGKNEVIAIMVSDSLEVEEEQVENMSMDRVEYIVDRSLPVDSGFNRYKWDMNMQGPWNKDKTRNYKNGHSAPPGPYVARLTVDGKKLEQSFTLKMDPRLDEHVSKTDIENQVALQIQIRELLSQARRLAEELENEKKKLQESDHKDRNSRLSAIQLKLGKLKTKEGIYEQPMLVDQISYLYNMLNDTDQAPGKDAQMRYEELKNLLGKIKE